MKINFGERKENFKKDISEWKTFILEHRYQLFSWSAVFLLLSIVSIFFTEEKISPLMMANVLPRALSLALLTVYAFLTKYRRTLFSVGATVWMVWMILAAGGGGGLATFVALLGILITLVFVRIECIKKHNSVRLLFLKNEILWFYSLAAFNFFLEFLHRMDFSKPFLNLYSPVKELLFTPDIFMDNLIVLMITGVFVFACRRPKFGMTVYGVVWIALVFVSIQKINNVYEPFRILDIFATIDMAAVITKYFKWYFFVLLAIALVGIVALLVFIIKKEKVKPVKARSVISVLLAVIILITDFVATSNLDYTQFDQSLTIDNYFEQGFPSSFIRYMGSSIPTEPEGYSEETIDEITKIINERYGEETAAGSVKNIIVVQMESFMDPYLLCEYDEDITYEFDPTPFIHSLKEQYTTGKVGVSIFAGQTCKSEFEFLTGVNIDNLPGGYNPYVTSTNTTVTDSLARYFSENNYKTTAIHNFQGEFFSRNEVYENLGFDTFVPVECMYGVQRRGTSIWAGDDCFASEVEAVLDSNTEDENGNFIYCVTAQLHGDYEPIDEEEYAMEITGVEDEKTLGKLEYYVKELIEFDKAMESLITMLEQREEPTVVLFYADHLPKVATAVCDMPAEDRFQTEYYLWDNIGLEKQDEDLELYKLSTKLCNTIGVTGGFINKYHNCVTAEENETYEEIVDYAITFPSQEEQEKYTYEDYRIGISDPVIYTVEEENEESDGSLTENNRYIIRGSGFTEDTVAVVNGKTYNLDVISENEALLDMGKKELASGDTVLLRILGERLGTVFCESEEFTVKEAN